MYFSGDGAIRDEDGYVTITGRMDDVINISGHRLGTAEIEDVLVSFTDLRVRNNFSRTPMSPFLKPLSSAFRTRLRANRPLRSQF